MQRIQHRPISPDVLDIDGKSLHYKMPIGALSSITNRVTGVGMSVGESPSEASPSSDASSAWSCALTTTHVVR